MDDNKFKTDEEMVFISSDSELENFDVESMLENNKGDSKGSEGDEKDNWDFIEQFPEEKFLGFRLTSSKKNIGDFEIIELSSNKKTKSLKTHEELIKTYNMHCQGDPKILSDLAPFINMNIDEFRCWSIYDDKLIEEFLPDVWPTKHTLNQSTFFLRNKRITDISFSKKFGDKYTISFNLLGEYLTKRYR